MPNNRNSIKVMQFLCFLKSGFGKCNVYYVTKRVLKEVKRVTLNFKSLFFDPFLQCCFFIWVWQSQSSSLTFRLQITVSWAFPQDFQKFNHKHIFSLLSHFLTLFEFDNVFKKVQNFDLHCPKSIWPLLELWRDQD